LLLHVVKELAMPSWLRGSAAVRRRRLARAKGELENLARLSRPLVETATRVVAGHPATKIAAAAAAAKSELLVTRLRDRREWFGARRGSVSYHVLSHAAVPVLACPRQWRPR
jgi:nucleotide-binding universal stress UspA family protein